MVDSDQHLQIAIVGHSFVKRLYRFTKSYRGFSNLNLDINNYEIDFRAKGGLTVKKLAESGLLSLEKDQIDCAFLQIGSNDATSLDKTVHDIAKDIVAIALYLFYGLGVKVVFIGQLLPRSELTTFRGYNAKIIEINNEISRRLSVENNPCIQLWHHHGFWQNMDFICWDGTHLNHFGIRRYFRSVRSSLLHARNILYVSIGDT